MEGCTVAVMDETVDVATDWHDDPECCTLGSVTRGDDASVCWYASDPETLGSGGGGAPGHSSSGEGGAGGVPSSLACPARAFSSGEVEPLPEVTIATTDDSFEPGWGGLLVNVLMVVAVVYGLRRISDGLRGGDS